MLNQQPQVSNDHELLVSLSRPSLILVIFRSSTAPASPPFPAPAFFNLDFQESREIIKTKLRNHELMSGSAKPRLGPYLSCFSEKVMFFSRRPGEGRASRFSSYQERLRRNPARRVNLVKQETSPPSLERRSVELGCWDNCFFYLDKRQDYFCFAFCYIAVRYSVPLTIYQSVGARTHNIEKNRTLNVTRDV